MKGVQSFSRYFFWMLRSAFWHTVSSLAMISSHTPDAAGRLEEASTVSGPVLFLCNNVISKNQTAQPVFLFPVEFVPAAEKQPGLFWHYRFGVVLMEKDLMNNSSGRRFIHVLTEKRGLTNAIIADVWFF